MTLFPCLARKIAAPALLALLAGGASAQQCGNDASGFERWKAEFAPVAQASGIGQRGLQALANARYSQATINADRNQRGVRYALDDFIRIRLGSLDSFAAQARRERDRNPGFYQQLESIYGVPSGILLAIHGMETGFGRITGNENVVSSILTVAYDCRRSDFFRPHAIAALRLVDQGMNPGQSGAAHGEIGHMQFLPGNVLQYGQDANGDGRVDPTNLTDAMATAANFLRQKGWQPGQPYQEGTANFRVLNEWNAATVYQQAIALAAARIDG
ncbi:lytic murein transglycosylase [Wenxinia marina]|uniref:Membrane-bound lytic murein transglycosylase B n=1 Tax=Wenxinia marina DSM 24838 TaxID=1123501 RepID=A0A0D0NJC6_9RHOB|nr:lytic murein transglycosylase [Wenxinia marina]KIQ68440.1 Membrane-bound lytic murein transglycosylase B [Wenxinia marina DSM 24838]GGL72253.1 murein transglycosylase [Wenxinia marina]